MPATDEHEADPLPELVNALRDAIDTLRYRRLGLPIGGPDATLRGRWAALGLSILVVFACFFALGRQMASSATSSAGAPAQLEGPSGRATIPAELSGGSPSAGAVPVAIVARPRPASPTPRVAAPRLPVEVAGAGVAAAPAQTAGAATRAQGEAPAPEPARAANPAPAPAPSTSAAPGTRSAGSGSSPPPPPPSQRSGAGSGSAGGAAEAPAGAPLPAGRTFDTSE